MNEAQRNDSWQKCGSFEVGTPGGQMCTKLNFFSYLFSLFPSISACEIPLKWFGGNQSTTLWLKMQKIPIEDHSACKKNVYEYFHHFKTILKWFYRLK